MSDITHLTFWLEQLAKPLKTFIRDINPCLIRLNSAKGEILSRYCHLGECIEKCRLSDIWQTNLKKRVTITNMN